MVISSNKAELPKVDIIPGIFGLMSIKLNKPHKLSRDKGK